MKSILPLLKIFALSSILISTSHAEHQLKIKTDGSATQSIYLVGNDRWGTLNNGRCLENLKLRPGWVETPFFLQDGSIVSVLGFSSPNCTVGLRKKIRDRVPDNDGLQFMWVPLF